MWYSSSTVSVAISIASVLISIVTQFLPKLNDATAVVPDPQNGSRTHPSLGHDDLIILSSNLIGFCVGYFLLFFSLLDMKYTSSQKFCMGTPFDSWV